MRQQNQCGARVFTAACDHWQQLTPMRSTVSWASRRPTFTHRVASSLLLRRTLLLHTGIRPIATAAMDSEVEAVPLSSRQLYSVAPMMDWTVGVVG